MKNNKNNFNDLPFELIRDDICKFLLPRNLSRLGSCNKFLKDVTNECEDTWKNLCLKKWNKLANLPKYDKKTNTLNLFSNARYSNKCEKKMKIKQLKQLLKNREVNTTKFLEKKEFINSLRKTNPIEVHGWKHLYDSLYKTSYIYAAFDMCRTLITPKELYENDWIVDFKGGNMRSNCNFLKNGDFKSDITDARNVQLKWVLYKDKVSIGPYPPHTVYKKKDNSWQMENDYVILRQKFDHMQYD